MVDIKNTKELLIFTSRLVNSIDKTVADGKVTISDAGFLFDPLFSAKPAFDDFAEIPAELSDLDEAEATELVQVVNSELDLISDEAELIAEEALALSVAIVNLVNRIRRARNS